jgi:RimJ/RimL family protein N-acetyltransferase
MVRRLTAEDAAAYVALRRAMLLDTPWAFSASPESDRGSVVERVLESLANPGFALIGAFEPDGIASVAGLHREDKPKRAHIVWIWGVYTAQQHRRRGLSRGVLKHAIDLARSWPGAACVQLSVSERSPEARALYESLGFANWGTEPDAIRVDGRSFAETHMRRELST